MEKQRYIGKPAIALLMRDASKKIRTKILGKQRQEHYQKAVHSESFTSTVSHEMRTPIGIAIFFLARCMKIIEGLTLDP